MNRHSWLFKFAAKAFKYYLLGLFGFLVTCILAWVLGAFVALAPWLPEIVAWFGRVAGFLACVMAAAVVGESLRY